MLKKTGILPRAVKLRFVFLTVILTFVWVNLLPAQNTVVPFYDINQNGRQDSNEPKVEGLTVTVAGSDTTQVALRVRLIKTYELVVSRADSTNSLHRQTDLTSTPFLPTSVALYPNYPNPFNPTTFLRFDLPTDAMVSLKIWDVLGNVVATLIESECKAGSHLVGFEARDLPSGIYFAKLVTGDYTQTRPLVLTK